MRKHLGKARYPALVVLVAVVMVLFWRTQLVDRTRAHAAVLPLLPTSSELATGLIRAGLDPEALAAAGLSPGNVTALVGDAYEHLIANQTALELADAAHAQARQQADQLKRVIQSGRASQEQIDAYPAATLEVSQIQTQRQLLLAGIFEAATADLSQSKRNTLAAIRANRDWKLPLEFLTVDRTEAQWVELRDCLANERIAAEIDDEEPDSQAQAVLAQLRGIPAVASARANFDANHAVVMTAWEQTVGQ